MRAVPPGRGPRPPRGARLPGAARRHRHRPRARRPLHGAGAGRHRRRRRGRRTRGGPRPGAGGGRPGQVRRGASLGPGGASSDRTRREGRGGRGRATARPTRDPRRDACRPGKLPVATVARLPRYLQALVDAAEAGRSTISSDELAAEAGLNSAIVRKDVSYLGTAGTRGVGYSVADLTTEISAILGISVDRPVVIVGIGNLGRALASYGGFTRRGFRDGRARRCRPGPDRHGGRRPPRRVDRPAPRRSSATGGCTSRSSPRRPSTRRRRRTSSSAAGVTALLNFAPVRLRSPSTSPSGPSTCRPSCRSCRSTSSSAANGLPAATG